MKNLITLLTLLFSTQFVMAITSVSVGDGNWSDPTTWDSGSVPQSGDTIIIAANHTVTVDCNCGIYANFQLDVFGSLYFPNGSKINLDSMGRIDVFIGGRIYGGNGGSKIIIAGDTKWRGNDPDIIGLAYLDVYNSDPVSLPIELAYFNAKLEGNQVVFNWATDSETNNDFFSIERTMNGLDWETVLTVDGAGNSVAPINYTAIDKKPKFGISYYRLKQTDFDGTATLSKILAIENKTLTSINIYPNPASDYLTIEGTGIGQANFMVLNSFGQLVNVSHSNSSDAISFDVSNLTSGVYFFNINSNGNAETHKVIIQ